MTDKQKLILLMIMIRHDVKSSIVSNIAQNDKLNNYHKTHTHKLFTHKWFTPGNYIIIRHLIGRFDDSPPHHLRCSLWVNLVG